MEKRFILALVLTFLILAVFYTLFPPPSPDKGGKKEETERGERIVEEPIYQPEPHKGVSIDFPLYTAFISEKGGLRSFILKGYKTRKAGVSQIEQELRSAFERAKAQSGTENTNLFYSMKLRYTLDYIKAHGNKDGLQLVSFSQIYNNSLPPFIEWRDERNNTVWKEQGTYEISQKGAHKFFLSQRIMGDVRLEKNFTFHPESYLVNVTVILENMGKENLSSGDLFIICGPDMGIEEGIRAYTYHGPMVLIDGKLKRERLLRRKKNKMVENVIHGNVSWVALQDKYFCEVIIPQERVEGAYIRKNEFEEYSVGLKTKISPLGPGQRKEFSFDMYLGPKELEAMQKIGHNLVKIVDYGFFGNLFHLIHVLKFFYRLTHNYGLAIILLTLLINMILFPLSFKGFKSMKEMRKLQPEMERIRRQFKDDPQRMNKEVMELYRRHKVNPAGGCLPMLFQMPIFVGLFMTLRSATELRGASFLWIQDLSLPDTVYTIPFSIPFLGSSLNLLPLIMTGISFLQQKISGGGSSKTMLFFPLFLLFIFYNFPSGLVLYFLCSNSINILEQLWIGRQGTKKV